MSNSIPADIWMCVAQFIPKHELRSMFSINSAFFELAMDVRYRRIRWATFDDAGLERMRSLRFVFDYALLLTFTDCKDRNPLISHRVRELWVGLGYGYEGYLRYDNMPAWSRGRSLRNVMRTMIDTVACLTSVTDFSIEWTDIPSEKHVRPFLTAAWRTFGIHLRSIYFRVPLKYLSTLLFSADGPKELRKLHVELVRPIGILRVTEGEALATTLAQFVNKVAPTLHELSLSSLHHDFELSPLFQQLGHIPNLERFSIFVDAAASIPRVFDPLGLTGFLRNQATTLRHLHWTGTLVAEHLMEEVRSINGDLQEGRMLNWLRVHELDKIFSDLLTLQLPVPCDPAGVTLISHCIRRSVRTLSSLGLGDRYLGYHEARSLASMFAHRRTGRLRELDVQVKCLSPELITLLARLLPRLETLGITFLYVKAKNDARVKHPTKKEQELALAREFASGMQKYDVRDWSLHNIRIIKHNPWDSELNVKLMWVLAECIPSVETFDGVDKEVYADIKLEKRVMSL